MKANCSFVTVIFASMLAGAWALAHSDLAFRPQANNASYQGIVARG